MKRVDENSAWGDGEGDGQGEWVVMEEKKGCRKGDKRASSAQLGWSDSQSILGGARESSLT